MKLTDELIKDEYLKTPAIIKAFRAIDRSDFLTEEERHRAEVNAPLPIGCGQTISQPLTVAFMLELLQPATGDVVLDVGSGSGWTTALLASIVGITGKVYGLERIRQLKEFGEVNVNKYNFTAKGIVEFICTDGHRGLTEHAPFDRILVSAASHDIPSALLDQLKVGGRMVLPVGQWYDTQEIIMIEKEDDHRFSETRYPGFIFVPLIKDE